MTRTSAYKRSLKGASPKKRKQRRQLRVMQCRSSAGPCRDLPESSCALVIRDTLLCTSWPPGLCPLARATGLCMALLAIFLFSVRLCFVVSNLRDAIWVAFSINVYIPLTIVTCSVFVDLKRSSEVLVTDCQSQIGTQGCFGTPFLVPSRSLGVHQGSRRWIASGCRPNPGEDGRHRLGSRGSIGENSVTGTNT